MKPRLNFSPTVVKWDYFIVLSYPRNCSIDNYKITKSMVKISKLTGRPIKRRLPDEDFCPVIYES